jgi:outer membrane receptor protein involved in Fe transport
MRYSKAFALLFAAGVLTPESASGQMAAQDSGTIVGTVTDKATDSPLPGAVVSAEGAARNATTDDAGRYRLTGIEVGRRTIRARYIGYAPLSASVTVLAGGNDTVDFALVKSVQKLDELVTTGTFTPTAVKALPTPMTVISAADIDALNPRGIQQVFRQFVPSGVAWDLGTNPQQTSISARGAASLSSLNGTMKVYLDGIEVSDRNNAAIDPKSIDRIEVIRGPQAAAIYGSDAIGGVMQVFTKRGDSTLPRPQVEAQAALGVVQSPYGGYSGALRQDYSALIRGGTPAMSYSFGGGYIRTGDWVPDSKSSSPSAFGGIHLAQDHLSADLSGRYYAQKTPESFDPRIGEAWSFFATPFYREYFNQEQTYGARLTFDASSSWQHRLSIGVDRYSIDAHQTRPRLTFPGDTLLFVADEDRSKTSVAYNTTVQFTLAPTVHGAVTAGVDHYTIRQTNFFTQGAIQTTGSLVTAPGQEPQASRAVTTNTGYLAQLQLAFHEALFLTGGLRLEDNSSFGADLNTPVSPRVGASYVRPFSLGTIKVRGSYGEAINPPAPGQRDAHVFPTNRQLANPLLGPERQSGWDAGLDLILGEYLSFSATYYHQIARDLIALVRPVVGSLDGQYQNVGKVRNAGLELEGSYSRRWLRLSAQYAITRARVLELGPLYTGDLRIGDLVPVIPEHTGGISLTVTPLRQTSVAVGVTYFGSWMFTDVFALFACVGGTAPCRTSNRDYLTEYPRLVKASLAVRYAMTSRISGFVAIDNLTNNDNFEVSNLSPIVGRISTFGLRLLY